ncbi:MAG: ATP synthase subunit I [Pseudomonadota bacterium]|jgi:ATP synthase protein I
MARTAAYRAVSAQVIAGIAGAALFYYLQGLQAAHAAFYGAAVALANKMLLVWYVRQGKHRPPVDAQKQLREFYRASLARFLAISLLLAVGMGPLGLAPLPVLAGFVLGQLTLIVSQFTRGIE